MSKSVVIMGGGMAGLCAAALLTRRGFQVTLLEKQEKTGGYVTGFKRDNFYFDATGAFLASCRKGSDFFAVFTELGLEDKLSFIPIPAIRNIYPSYELNLDYRNPANYVNTLKNKFPRYADKLQQYADLTARLGQEFLRFEAAPWWKKCFLPLAYPTLFKCARHSHGTILHHFFGENDEISHGLSALPTTLPPSKLSYIFVAVLWAKVLKDGVFYPEGGMVRVTDMLTEYISNHGGMVEKGTGVVAINTCGRRVENIVTDKGKTLQADWYIGAMNPYSAQAMLKGCTKLYGRMFALQRFSVSPSALLFYLGIKKSAFPDNWPYFVSLHTGQNPEKEATSIERGLLEDALHLVITTPSLLDKNLAPKGFHTMKILVHAPHASRFKESFPADKVNDLRQKVFEIIARKTGLIIKNNHVVSITATPDTLSQRTGNEEGAMYGLDAALGQVGPGRPPTKTALKNLLWVGHYVRPAHGIVGSGLSGSFAANIIADYD